MFWSFWPRGMWHLSSLTRDQTHNPCTGRQSLNHWTTREVPVGLCFYCTSFSVFLSFSFFSLHFLFWLLYVFSVFLKYVKFVLKKKKTSRQAVFFFFFWCWDVFISRAHGHTNLWMSSVKTETSIWVHLCYDTELEKEEHLLCLKIYQFRGSWIRWAS